MTPNESYKYFGLLSAIILLVGLIGVTRLWRQGSNKTFSQLVAESNAGVSYYIALFVVALIPLSLFFIDWFTPTYKLPLPFSTLITISIAAQLLCTLVPERGRKKTVIHQVLAGISAICLPIALVVALALGAFTQMQRITLVASLVVMVAVIVIIFLRIFIYKKLLMLQSAYFAAFFLGILYVSYL